MNQVKVTRTYLEMLEKPTAAAMSAMEHLQIIRAINPTVSFYRYLYNTVGDAWTWMDRRKMPDEELSRIIQDDRVEIYVAYASGTPAGYVELNCQRSDDVEIAYFGIMPEFIGHGLGRYLLSWAIETAWNRSPKRVWLHTCTLDHPRALPLYKKVGFKVYKTEDYFVDSPDKE
jgi:GNAT superfamily N-acetyltransferase